MMDLCDRRDVGAGKALFANEEWLVLEDGLEHRGTGYFIERSGLAARHRDGLWMWPLQMAEKSWCLPRPFREAFAHALVLFGVAEDADLARSFAVGSDVRTGSNRTGEGSFVSLGALLRTRSNDRKRPAPVETRSAPARRGPAQERVAVASTA